MKKSLYILSVVFLSLCAVAIITCCAVFSRLEETENITNSNLPTVEFDSDDLKFDYEDTLSINIGDKLNIAPTILQNVDIYKFSYYSLDNSVVSLDGDGNIYANKCGKTYVEIKNHNVTINTVEINVDYSFEFDNMNACIFKDGKLFLSKNSAKFQVYIVNSSNQRQLTNISPTLSTTEGIVAYSKMGSVIISTIKSGSISMSYPQYNINILLPIVVG